MDISIIVILILVAVIVIYITELIPIATTSISACVLFVLVGAVPAERAFLGFGNGIIFMISGMMVVGYALYETGVSHFIGDKAIHLFGTNIKKLSVIFIIISIPFSAFLSVTATAAIMLPIVSSAVVASKGKISESDLFMAVGISAVLGGNLSLISSTPQLIAQGILHEGRFETFHFFEMSKIGIPLILALIIYILTLGSALHKKVIKCATKKPFASEILVANKDKCKLRTSKQLTVVIILIFCVIGFIFSSGNVWISGVIAISAAVICIITGCITEKTALSKLDWTTIIVIGCSFCFAYALDYSGAGILVTQKLINIIGNDISPWLFCAVFVSIGFILGNFMSNTATASLIVPISIIMSQELGFDVKNVAIIVAVASNISFSTPISTPAMTMTLSGGYKFKDYLIVAGLFNIIVFLIVVLMIPIILN